MNSGWTRRGGLTKLALVFFYPVVALSATGATPATDIGFRGIVDFGDSQLFSLFSDEGNERNWVAVGDVFAGYEIVAFQPNEQVLLLSKDGKDYSLSLGSGRLKRADIDSEDGLIHTSDLRQVGQASLIYANDNDDRLPGGEQVESIHDVARLLATVGLNDTSMWITGGDAETGNEEHLRTVLDSSRDGIDPRFAAQDIVSIDFATNLDMSMPSTTPVAWTRGLRADGTWDERGVFGSSGGFIVFLGGNVERFSDLNSEGGHLVGRDGNRTGNILEALPPGAGVVGAGPATLDGATGSPDE